MPNHAPLRTRHDVVGNDHCAGSLSLGRSYMLDFENGANPFRDRANNISEWRNLTVVDISGSASTFERSQRLAALGFRFKDTVRLSCVMEAGCAIFLTTDIGILKKAALISNLAILNPVDYDFTSP